MLPIYSERLSEGPIFDLCKQMIPRGKMNAAQVKSYEPKKGEDAATPHTDRNLGDSFTIVFDHSLAESSRLKERSPTQPDACGADTMQVKVIR